MPDYKLPALASISLEHQQLGNNLKTEATREVAKAFVGNADRVVSAGWLPVRLLNLGNQFQSVWVRAAHEVVGDGIHQLSGYQYIKEAPRITERCKRIADEDHEKYSQYGSPTMFSEAWLAALDGDAEKVRGRFEGVFSIIDAMVECTGDYLVKGIESALSSMIVGTWTAFETLAGDLWISTLNAHPRGLDRLSGEEKRIHKAVQKKRKKVGIQRRKERQQERQQEGEKDIKLNALHNVTDHGYDLTFRMGELLRAKVAFTSIYEIRRAYSLAFDYREVGEKVTGAVDGILADTALDALAQVRNIIVHKAGIADADYDDYRAWLLTMPQVARGELVPLDGNKVQELVNPVIACCVKLLTAIDEWLDGGSVPAERNTRAGI